MVKPPPIDIIRKKQINKALFRLIKKPVQIIKSTSQNVVTSDDKRQFKRDVSLLQGALNSSSQQMIERDLYDIERLNVQATKTSNLPSPPPPPPAKPEVQTNKSASISYEMSAKNNSTYKESINDSYNLDTSAHKSEKQGLDKYDESSSSKLDDSYAQMKNKDDSYISKSNDNGSDSYMN